MDLTIYDVIKGPVLSDKASKLAQENSKKAILQVHPKANKPMIKKALEKLFNVEIASIRTIVKKGKTKSFRRIESKGKRKKRAIITLKPGYSLSGSDTIKTETTPSG